MFSKRCVFGVVLLGGVLCSGCQNMAGSYPPTQKQTSDFSAVKNTCTLFYVWSPRMALSTQHANTVFNVAHSAHLKMKTLHPSTIQEAELFATLVYLNKIHPQSAIVLRQSKAYLIADSDGTNKKESAKNTVPSRPIVHYPAVWIEKQDSRGNTFRSKTIVGVMPTPYWKQTINKMKRQTEC